MSDKFEQIKEAIIHLTDFAQGQLKHMDDVPDEIDFVYIQDELCKMVDEKFKLQQTLVEDLDALTEQYEKLAKEYDDLVDEKVEAEEERDNFQNIIDEIWTTSYHAPEINTSNMDVNDIENLNDAMMDIYDTVDRVKK